ncbi:glycosyltransferase [Vibrio aquaticus]|uniref:glycosyltransferase n=1 Tax=Vibrio aquaticus TaxID=2496559 RepID=UPI00131A3998|nr:glycosyltransferase [Vibrio aquaticus]
MDFKKLTVIVPVYNESDSLNNSMSSLLETLEQVECDCRLLLVDDGSQDDSWAQIDSFVKLNSCVSAIKLSKNYGKDKAILAGLEYEDSDLYLVIDSDGEHPFDRIVDFFSTMKEKKWDIVHGIKKGRRGSSFYKFLARSYNKVFHSFTNVHLLESSDFKLFNRKVRNSVISYGDIDFFFRAVCQDVGFRSTTIEFSENQREQGQSSWSLIRLFSFAFNSIVSFSHIPLYLILFLGLISILVCTVLSIKLAFQYLIYNNVPEGYTTIILLSSGAIGITMISLGVVGVYLSKIFDLTKNRPRYIIESSIGENE